MKEVFGIKRIVNLLLVFWFTTPTEMQHTLEDGNKVVDLTEGLRYIFLIFRLLVFSSLYYLSNGFSGRVFVSVNSVVTFGR